MGKGAEPRIIFWTLTIEVEVGVAVFAPVTVMVGVLVLTAVKVIVGVEEDGVMAKVAVWVK